MDNRGDVDKTMTMSMSSRIEQTMILNRLKETL